MRDWAGPRCRRTCGAQIVVEQMPRPHNGIYQQPYGHDDDRGEKKAHQ
jgi:hypothetical protein